MRFRGIAHALLPFCVISVPGYPATATIDFDPPAFSLGRTVSKVGIVTFVDTPVVFAPSQAFTPPQALQSATPCKVIGGPFDLECPDTATELRMTFDQGVSDVSLRAGDDGFVCVEGCAVLARLVGFDEDGRLVADSRDLSIDVGVAGVNSGGSIRTQLSITDPAARIRSAILFVGRNLFSGYASVTTRAKIDHLVVTYPDIIPAPPPLPTPPTVTITFPADQTYFADAWVRFTPIPIRGRLTAPGGLAAFCYTTNTPAVPVPSTCSSGRYVNPDNSFGPIDIAPASLNPGLNVISVFVFDLAGQSARASVRLQLPPREQQAPKCPFPGPILSPRVLSVAFIPAKFSDNPNTLTISQVLARAQYVRDYYFQQSMCSVVINPVIVTDPAATDGWFTLPTTLAQFRSTASSLGEQIAITQMWIEAFTLASAKQATFLAAQQLGFFQAVFVSTTWPSDAFISTSLVNNGVAQNPLVQALVAAIKTGAAGDIGGALTGLGPIIYLTPLAAIAIPALNAFGAALAPLLEQGSIVASDTDSSGTWTHELGHGLFTWWDYYDGATPTFSTRGDLGAWDIMGTGNNTTPPAPVASFHKFLAGMVTYTDICSSCFGDYALTALKDMPLLSQVLRYETPRDFFRYPRGPVAWYIFELREPPDDVSITPEQVGTSLSFPPPGNGRAGVVIYQQRDVQRFLGVPTVNPYCGPAHGAILQGFLDTAIDFGFGSCFEKVDNPDRDNFTLVPGGMFYDDISNVTFSLSSDISKPVLSIRGTTKSRTVVRMQFQIDTELGSISMRSHPDPLSLGLGRVDLHVFTADGRHVGPNYTTGHYDLGIAGGRAGGINTPEQWISIPDDIQVFYLVDASQAAAAAKKLGLQTFHITAATSMFRYDANGVRGNLGESRSFALDLGQTVTARLAMPLGAPLGFIRDTTPPTVTVAADVTVGATEAGGARANNSRALATFLAGASAVDTVDPFPSALPPQASGVNVSSATLFPLGTTTVTFRFQDANSNIGAAMAKVTVIVRPAVSSHGVVSASQFSRAAGAAPGTWLEIFGSNLSTTTRAWRSSDFNGNTAPTSLDGVSVKIGGKDAYVSYVSSGQVNVQVPDGIPVGAEAALVVTNSLGQSEPYSLQIWDIAPALLAPANFAVQGKQYVLANFPINNPNEIVYVGKTGAIAGATTRPAKPGEVITLYGIGFGPASPATGAGMIAPEMSSTINPITILFGRTAADLVYAGLAPNWVGLYQFNVRVPNIAAGDSRLVVRVGNKILPQTLYITTAQ